MRVHKSTVTGWIIYSYWLLTLSLVLSTASGHSSGKFARAPRGATVFKGNYFVHIKSSVSVAEIHAFVEELTEIDETGFYINIRGIVQNAAHGFSAKMSKVALSKVLKSKLVELVEEDHYLKAGSVRETSVWGLDRLDETSATYDESFEQPCNLTGKGVDVYILDSGIHSSHVEFEGRVVYPACDPLSLVHGLNESKVDCTGHGTHVAGIAAGASVGVAPEAILVSIRVLSCDNMGTVNTLVHGIECVLNSVEERKRPGIVNLSLYGEKNRALKRAVDNLIRSGVTVVSIAGNDEVKSKDSCKLNPASIQGVLTVAASTKEDQAFRLSNAGACVDLYAPGDNIRSSDSECDTCYSNQRGTSLAAPYVTGTLALLLEKCPAMPPWKVRYILMSQLVLADKLDYSLMPKKFHMLTPNLLLHTSSLQCDVQC